MSREVRLYLEDMRDCASKVQRYAIGVSFEAFVANEEKRDAIVRNLELIGEAAKHVPDEVRARHTDVEWRKIAGSPPPRGADSPGGPDLNCQHNHSQRRCVLRLGRASG